MNCPHLIMNKIKVTALVVTIFSFLSISCSSKNKSLYQKEMAERKNALDTYYFFQADNQKKNQAIKEYISRLSMEEKIAQVFMINLEKDDKFFPVEWYFKSEISDDGTEKKEKKVLIPAGYIFFGYNVSKNPETIMGFTDSILEQAYCQETIAPFISIDVEGGFVNRLRGVAGPLPENQRIAQCLIPDQAFVLYSLYAAQMNALGFNLNLAPVAEVENDNNQEFLCGRSYGNQMQVQSYSTQAVKAYQSYNVGTVLKHFPGNTNVDPHIGLPKIDMSQDEFLEIKEVFSNAINFNPDGVLMSHAIVPAFDKHPACLSKFWISDIMRNELKFDGIIFSDDIFMGALIDNGYSPAIASKMAIEAGINCIMISEKKFGKWMELLINICQEDPDFLLKIDESVFKMIEFKIRRNLIFLEYNQITDSYEVQVIKNQKDIVTENFEKRQSDFYDAKEKNLRLYHEYFYDTASDEEKRGLYIE